MVDCMTKLKRLRNFRPGLPGMQNLPTFAKVPISPRMSTEIADLVDIAKIAKFAEIASKECRDFRGCWDCLNCRPRLQRRLPAYIAEIAENADNGNLARVSPEIAVISDIASRDWEIACSDRKIAGRDCWGCRFFYTEISMKIAETAEIAVITENADIAKIAESFNRDCWVYQYCRDCWPIIWDWMLRLKKLPRLPGHQRLRAKNGEIAEFSDRDWDGDCRSTLKRLPRSISPRLPRVLPEIAKIPDIAGHEWEIACWDFKNCRDCQPGLLRVPNFLDWVCDRDCRPTLSRLPRVPRLLRPPRLRRTLTAEIAGRHCRFYRPRMPRFRRRLPRVPRLPNLHTEVATEIAGRHCREYNICRDHRDCRL